MCKIAYNIFMIDIGIMIFRLHEVSLVSEITHYQRQTSQWKKCTKALKKYIVVVSAENRQ